LDDPFDIAVRGAHDPAVQPRVVGLRSENGRVGTGAPVRVDERAQERRRQHRRVAGEDQHVSLVAGECRARRANGVAGTEGLLLHRNDEPAVCEAILCRRRGDDDDRVGARTATGVDDPVDHRPAEHEVEVLRHVGPHPGAEAPGHQHGCERCVDHRGVWDGWGARIRTWDRGTKTRCLTAWLRPTSRGVYGGYGRSVNRKISAAIASSAITPIAAHSTILSAIGTHRTSSCDAAKIQPIWRSVSERLPRATYHQKPTAMTASRTASHQCSAWKR